MIKQFADVVTFFLVQDSIITEDDWDIYQYGTEQILINLVALVFVGVIASMSKSFWKQFSYFLECYQFAG